jgi:hypothetical protein
MFFYKKALFHDTIFIFMQLMKKVQEILNQFEAISLNALVNAQLMNRVDSKFIFHLSELPDILKELKVDYQVLEVNDQRISEYENLYFDTHKHRFYLDHHNNKNHRFKVRFRKYGNSNTTYFEIKERRKNRMDKQRFQVDEMRNELLEKEHHLIQEVLGIKTSLKPMLINQYQRITLVNETLKERFTLDYRLTFQSGGKVKAVDNVVIAELKQQNLNRESPVFQLMNQKKIRTFRISKYCIGTVLLFSKKDVKYNNFKYIIQKLNTFKNAV